MSEGCDERVSKGVIKWERDGNGRERVIVREAGGHERGLLKGSFRGS